MTQVLHLHWLASASPAEPSKLFIWGETSQTEQPKRDRRKRSAQPHPFLLGQVAVSQAVKQVIPWYKYHPLRWKTEQLWLPTNQFGPAPSPDLLHDWEPDPTPPTLLPWQVQGVYLESADAFQFLVGLSQKEFTRIRLGVNGRYYQHAINFALELLAQQKIRPTLIDVSHPQGNYHEARWLPILDAEEDAHRLKQLAEAMPPSCQAFASDPQTPPASQAILDSFLNTLTDAAMRLWATKKELYLPTTNREPAHVWLRALFRKNPIVDLPIAQRQHLQSSYQAWTRALTIAGNRHYRVAFRLEAPNQQTTDGQTWQLHYLLQARDDASLMIPAQQVWQTQGNILQTLTHKFERPQERLLMGLGYAGRFFEPIQQSLNQPNPISVTLTDQQAFSFLRDTAPQLQQSGFGILTPPWWNKPGTRLGVRLKLSSNAVSNTPVSQGHMSLNNLVKYRWELSIGETTLTRQEFDALVALKSPFVQIRGQWVQLDPEQIEAAIQFWKKQKSLEGTFSLHEAMQHGLGEDDTQHGLKVDGVTLDEWLQNWLNQLQGDEKLTPLPPPENLQATLRPYQQYGYSWLDFARRWGMGAILADDMGLGKTIQTLTMIQKLKNEQGSLTKPVLLICPTSVVINWKLEANKFTPDLKTMVHQGSDRLRDNDFLEATDELDMVLTSYAIVRRDAEVMQQVHWKGIALDEAQNIKNANTKQAQVIRRLTADFRLALTGTPIENRLSELWSIMQFLNPGFLGGQQTFRKKFILPIEKYQDETAMHKLRKLARPFILRRVKTDPTVITDLPEKQEVKVYCNLSQEQATLYEAIVQDALKAIEEEESSAMARKGLVLSMLMQLKQVCNHPVQYLHQSETYSSFEDQHRSGKLQRFHAILEEVLAEGDRLLVFSQFKTMGSILKQYVQEQFGVPALFLHGGVKPDKRADMVTQFQTEGGPPVFVLSLKAGGTGLNLTHANHVFHFDRWWNPAVENQATDRAFRIGQKRNVLVHKFVCLGTLEERIDQMIEEKKALADSIVGSGENWLTEMNTAHLRELVTLREQVR